MMMCIIIREKFYDYMEGDLNNGFSSIIEEHIIHCGSCRKIYEDELRITNLFKNVLNVNNVRFNSCKATILKCINPNRYRKSFFSSLSLRTKE